MTRVLPEGIPYEATISRRNGRWYASIAYWKPLLSPSRAVILAEAGYSKRDAQEPAPTGSAAEGHRQPRRTQGRERQMVASPRVQSLENQPDATIPMLESPASTCCS